MCYLVIVWVGRCLPIWNSHRGRKSKCISKCFSLVHWTFSWNCCRKYQMQMQCFLFWIYMNIYKCSFLMSKYILISVYSHLRQHWARRGHFRYCLFKTVVDVAREIQFSLFNVLFTIECYCWVLLGSSKYVCEWRFIWPNVTHNATVLPWLHTKGRATQKVKLIVWPPLAVVALNNHIECLCQRPALIAGPMGVSYWIQCLCPLCSILFKLLGFAMVESEYICNSFFKH